MNDPNVYATPGVLRTFHLAWLLECLARHQSGDWGDVCPEDRRANNDAAVHGDRILSIYKLGKHTLWVITEADRSTTTMLLPEDY